MSTETIAEDRVVIPGAPDIPGLTFRSFRGEEDFPGMVEVLHAASAADKQDDARTVDDIARSYRNLKNSDAARDIVMVDLNGEMVAYKRVEWLQEEATGTYVYNHFGFMKPEVRGKGLGRALFRHSENRLREIAADHPADAPKFFATGVNTGQEGLRDLIESEGYTPVRVFYEMVRPDLENIPDMPLPEGLDVRPVRPEDYRAIWEAEVEAFKDHWGEATADEVDYQRWLNEPMFQPELWQVAWDGDQVAGMVRNFISEPENEKYGRKRGYVENISVRRAYRKRGLARALIALSFLMHKERGMTEGALGVDSENPTGALHVYRAMGFEIARNYTEYRKPLV